MSEETPQVGDVEYTLTQGVFGDPPFVIRRTEVLAVLETREAARQWMLDHEDEWAEEKKPLCTCGAGGGPVALTQHDEDCPLRGVNDGGGYWTSDEGRLNEAIRRGLRRAGITGQLAHLVGPVLDEIQTTLRGEAQ